MGEMGHGVGGTAQCWGVGQGSTGALGYSGAPHHWGGLGGIVQSRAPSAGVGLGLTGFPTLLQECPLVSLLHLNLSKCCACILCWNPRLKGGSRSPSVSPAHRRGCTN